MNLRPYKTVVFRHLSRILSGVSEKHAGKFAIDAASAGMKNIKLFGQLKYVGIDIDKKLIIQGIKDNPTAIGVCGDLTRVRFRPNTAIVAVSTHTLEAIRNSTQRLEFVNELISVTSKDGKMILLTYLKDEINPNDIINLVESSFSKVSKTYYGLPVTRWIEEKVFIPLKGKIENENFLKKVIGVFLFPLYVLLIFLEIVFAGHNQNHAVVLLECSEKKDGNLYMNDFEVLNCEKMSDSYWVMSGL